MMLVAVLLLCVSLAFAETGIDGWLRYARLDNAADLVHVVPGRVIALNGTDSSPVKTAGEELQLGLNGILGKKCAVSHGHQHGAGLQGSIVVGTVAQINEAGLGLEDGIQLEADGFWLNVNSSGVVIAGQNERGVLYGAFEYLSMLAQGDISQVSYASNPDAPIRWINQWDNLQAEGTHGSVERGYGGPSIFFADGIVKDDMTRAAQYARLLASIKVNAVIVNNVNANESILTEP